MGKAKPVGVESGSGNLTMSVWAGGVFIVTTSIKQVEKRRPREIQGQLKVTHGVRGKILVLLGLLSSP